jgi:hypothetical protein
MRRGDSHLPVSRMSSSRLGSLRDDLQLGLGSGARGPDCGEGPVSGLDRNADVWSGPRGFGHSKPVEVRLSTIRIVGHQWTIPASPFRVAQGALIPDLLSSVRPGRWR